jgi:hypothetical protein
MRFGCLVVLAWLMMPAAVPAAEGPSVVRFVEKDKGE